MLAVPWGGTIEGSYPSCYGCNGTGYIGSNTEARCGSCGASGRMSTREIVSCPRCAGTGREPGGGGSSHGSGSSPSPAGASAGSTSKISSKSEWKAIDWIVVFVVGFFTFAVTSRGTSAPSDEIWFHVVIAVIAGLFAGAIWRPVTKIMVVGDRLFQRAHLGQCRIGSVSSVAGLCNLRPFGVHCLSYLAMGRFHWRLGYSRAPSRDSRFR